MRHSLNAFARRCGRTIRRDTCRIGSFRSARFPTHSRVKKWRSRCVAYSRAWRRRRPPIDRPWRTPARSIISSSTPARSRITRWVRTLRCRRRVATVLAWRQAELRAKDATEMRRAIEAVVERDRGDGPGALGRADQRAGALIQASAHDVARNGFIAIREQMVQVAGRHFAGLGNA